MVIALVSLFTVSGYAYSITSNSIALTAFEANYKILHYNVAAKEENEEIVDFTALANASTYSNRSAWSCEPYTPTSDYSRSADGSRAIIDGISLDPVDDVTVAPYCKVVAVESIFHYIKNGVLMTHSWICTGVILGPNLVLTAGHAIYSNDYGGWVDYCNIYTEMESDTEYYSSTVATQITIHDRCKQGSGDYDWAYIMTETNIGNTQGWMGFSGEDIDNYIAAEMAVTVAGFPNNECIMKESHGNIVGKWSDQLLLAEISTTGGMSGAPIYSSDQYVRAILAGPGNGNDETEDTTDYLNNRGSAITPELFLLLRRAKNQG